MLPESVLAELTVLLWSELQGRVPQGRYAGFIEEAIREKIARMRGEAV